MTSRIPAAPADHLPDAHAPQDYHAGMLEPMVSMYEAEGARELVQTMRDDLPRQQADLEAAIARQDWNGAARVAHSLKSEVLMVAADALGHALEAAERAFKENDVDGGIAAMPALMDRCRRLFQRLGEAAGI